MPQESVSPSREADDEACALAQPAIELAGNRAENTSPSGDEIKLLRQFIAANPAEAVFLEVYLHEFRE